MIAFQVDIDGEAFVLAGTNDWSILALHITGSRGRDPCPGDENHTDQVRITVGGLTRTDSSGVRHHFRWEDRNLQVGSTVAVTVVDTDNPDPPIKRYRSDKELKENPFTDEEMREMRRQDYIALKKEFEKQ